jgi:hypothetical protein
VVTIIRSNDIEEKISSEDLVPGDVVSCLSHSDAKPNNFRQNNLCPLQSTFEIWTPDNFKHSMPISSLAVSGYQISGYISVVRLSNGLAAILFLEHSITGPDIRP